MPVRIVIISALLLAPLAPAWPDTVTVRLNGLSPELEDNARIFLNLTAVEERTDLSETAIRRLHRRATEQIRLALQPFGYYNPETLGKIMREAEGSWLTTYSVDPGTPVLLRHLTIDLTGPGRDNPALRKLLAADVLQTGDQLRHDRYENFKSALRRASFNQGYLDASLTTHTMHVDPAENIADIELVLETGPRFTFGQISIHQNALTDDLIRRYVGIEDGQPFEQSRLLDAQYALQDTGFFAAVEVTAEREHADNLRVPIIIQTIARKSQRYSAGIGYSSDVGPRVSLGWKNRRINTRGHKANIDLRVSKPSVDFSTRYSIPIGDPRSERFVWSFAHRDEDLGDDTESRRQELGATLTKVLGEWQRNLYLQLTHENTQIAQIRTSDVLLLPGISLSRSRGDTPVQPRSASRISADLRGSLQALGSDTDFIRFKLETRMIRPIGRGRILLRGDIGTSFVSQFSSLPASQRFFAGGDRSVRGYGFNELGSHDAEGRNVGGRHFVATSTEIEWPVAGRWSTAFFVDAGNAFDDFRDELEFSVGLGGRLLTPVGMIRLDIAKPVSEGDQTLRLHIGVGADL